MTNPEKDHRFYDINGDGKVDTSDMRATANPVVDGGISRFDRSQVGVGFLAVAAACFFLVRGCDSNGHAEKGPFEAKNDGVTLVTDLNSQTAKTVFSDDRPVNDMPKGVVLESFTFASRVQPKCQAKVMAVRSKLDNGENNKGFVYADQTAQRLVPLKLNPENVNRMNDFVSLYQKKMADIGQSGNSVRTVYSTPVRKRLMAQLAKNGSPCFANSLVKNNPEYTVVMNLQTIADSSPGENHRSQNGENGSGFNLSEALGKVDDRLASLANLAILSVLIGSVLYFAAGKSGQYFKNRRNSR